MCSETVGLFTQEITEETLNGKPNFLCNVQL